MARISIDRSECKRGRLPMVCMVCGQSAEETKRQTFTWHTPWIHFAILLGLLPWLILALILRKTMTVEVPVCSRHRSHFLKRSLFIGGLAILLLVGIFGLIALAVQTRPGGETSDWAVCAIPIFAVVVFGAIFAVSSIYIRPAEITDRDITLKGVHDDFVKALEDDPEQDDRPHRRLRDD